MSKLILPPHLSSPSESSSLIIPSSRLIVPDVGSLPADVQSAFGQAAARPLSKSAGGILMPAAKQIVTGQSIILDRKKA